MDQTNDNPKKIRIDMQTISQRVYDEKSRANRVKMVDTDIQFQLDHKVDSVSLRHQVIELMPNDQNLYNVVDYNEVLLVCVTSEPLSDLKIVNKAFLLEPNDELLSYTLTHDLKQINEKLYLCPINVDYISYLQLNLDNPISSMIQLRLIAKV